MKLLTQWIFAVASACTMSLGQEAAVSTQSVTVITDRFSSPTGSAKNTVEAVLPVSNPGISALPELASDGYWIDSAPINEVFQYLARAAGSQYYYNNELNGPQYNVTGHLKLSNPKKQMEELAVGYGLAVHEQGSTVYLMTEAQLSKLPVEVMCYPLKYLRGAHPGGNSSKSAEGEGGGTVGIADFEKLKSIIKPLLTHDSGQIEFEEKTNVLLVTDNTVKLQRVHDLLEQLDRPKQQIAINVRILRVRKAHGSKVGVDWTGILGDGLPIKASQSLNALFNLPNASQLTKALNMTQNLGSTFAANTTIAGGVPSVTSSFGRTGDTTTTNTTSRTRDYTDGAGLVFDALQMEAIVHALNDKNIVSQESCPTIITEDNEQGIISIVD
ncbi:MAG: hypothetical protein JWO08_558, partial [Verrucomicrobiaceae bacterium]|nr:hypothetical protein [Verrucomicrobiaceae bacterium]